MEVNVKRSATRINDYIKDSNENNIQDIRTAPRRLDASFKKIKRKTTTFFMTKFQKGLKNMRILSYPILEKKLI